MEKSMDKIVALAKSRGFVYPGSEIYGGLANTWDYGNLGVELKNNVKRAWWQKFIQENPYNVGVDCAILMNPQTWVASGHLGGFSDPLMDCKECHERFRADKIIEDFAEEKKIELKSSVDGWTQEEMRDFIEENQVPCPTCGKHNFTDIRQFNLMFKTFQGVTEADETIDLIGKAQCEDGYLNTYFTIKEPDRRWTNLKEGHELYTAGHMIEAAVAYYNATGKRKFLDIVSRFADLICETFGPEEGKCHGYPGHPEVELALVKLYRATGQKRYLDLAKYFIDTRGVGENYFFQEEKKEKYQQIFPEFAGYVPEYSQSHLPVREQKTAEGHAVRAVYLYSAMADLAYEYQDETLLDACKTLWNNMTEKRMYITGGIGSSGLLERFTTDYDLPNDRNYSESCASIGLAMFGNRMAQITKDAKYADIVEKALYNTVLAGIAMDGKSFFYVNPLEVWPDNCIERTSMEHVKPVRQKWFGVACCPPNIARTLASLGQYIYGADENSLYINLYISSQTKLLIGETETEVIMESSFLKDGTVTVHLESEKASKGTLALRIPGYTKEFTVWRGAQKIKTPLIKKGYLMITDLAASEEIKISCDMKARFVYANPKVRADEGKACIMRGPLVYCLEETDNGENLSSLYVDTKKALTENWEEQLLGGVMTVEAKGKRILEDHWTAEELYKEQPPELKDVTLKAVPYCYWGNRKTGEMAVWIRQLI